MTTFEVKQNDTDLPLSAETDISGATIQASIRTARAEGEVPAIVPVNVTDAASGDFDVIVSDLAWGEFDLEVRVSKDGRDIHIPRRGFHRLVISPNLDDPLAGPYVPSATLDQVIEEKFAGQADRLIPFAETAQEAAAEAGTFAASTEFDANRAGESAFQSGQSAGYALGHRNAAKSSADAAAASAASIAKDVPGGVPGLDGEARVPDARMPERLSAQALTSTIDASTRIVVNESIPRRPLASFALPGETLAYDNVGFAANSTVLQRAIDAQAASISAFAIDIPDGAGVRLKTSGTINNAKYGVLVKSRTRILGRSQLTSTIGSDVDSTPLFAAYGGTLNDVEIGDLAIDCSTQYQEKNGAPEYTTQLKAMFMQDIIRPRFHDLIIRNSWGTSIGCDALVDYAMTNITIYNPGRGIGVSGIDPFLASGGSGIGIGTGKYRNEAGVISGLIVHNAGRVALFYEKQTQYTYLSRGHRAVNVVSEGSWAALHDCGVDGLYAEVTSIGDQYGLLLDGTYLEPHAGINGDVTMNVDGATKAGVLFGAMPEGKYKIGGQIIRSKVGVLTKAGAKIGPNVQVRVDTRENSEAGVYLTSSTPVKALTITGRHENNGQDSASTRRSGVIIDMGTDMLDINVVARDTQDTRTQQYGVELRGASNTAVAAAIRGDARGNAVGGYLSAQTLTGDSVLSMVGATTTGPSRLAVTPDGSGALALSWDAPFPANDVTDYRIEYRQGTTGSWTAWARTASTATTARITGLTNRQPYQVRVAAVRGGTVGEFTAGPITATPIAQAIISDTFVRSNAATLGSTDGGSLGPVAWEYTASTSWKVQSNYARPGAGGLSVARVDTGLTSYSLEVVVADLNATSGTRQADVIFRYVDDANYWMVTPRINSSVAIWGIQKRVSGSNTVVAQFTDTPITNGDRIRVDVTTADIKVYVNGVLKGTYTDAAHSAGTRVGMRGSFTGDPVSKFGAASTSDPGFKVFAA